VAAGFVKISAGLFHPLSIPQSSFKMPEPDVAAIAEQPTHGSALVVVIEMKLGGSGVVIHTTTDFAVPGRPDLQCVKSLAPNAIEREIPACGSGPAASSVRVGFSVFRACSFGVRPSPFPLARIDSLAVGARPRSTLGLNLLSVSSPPPLFDDAPLITVLRS
jgi:hypothetical protein